MRPGEDLECRSGRREKAKTNWNLSPYLPILPCLNHFLSTFRPKYSLAFLTEEPVMGTFVSWLSPDVTTRRVPIHLQFSPHPPPVLLPIDPPLRLFPHSLLLSVKETLLTTHLQIEDRSRCG